MYTKNSAKVLELVWFPPPEEQQLIILYHSSYTQLPSGPSSSVRRQTILGSNLGGSWNSFFFLFPLTSLFSVTCLYIQHQPLRCLFPNYHIIKFISKNLKLFHSQLLHVVQIHKREISCILWTIFHHRNYQYLSIFNMLVYSACQLLFVASDSMIVAIYSYPLITDCGYPVGL